MFFFRAVIHLLMQRKIDLYIAYRGMAYNHGRENRKWRIWKEAEEKVLREADAEQQAEPNTVEDLLDKIENEKLYQALLAVDKHTLPILLLKMQGYSTREIAAMAGLTKRAVYKRLERFFYPFGEI